MNEQRGTWWKAALKALATVGCLNGYIKQEYKSTITFTFKLQDNPQRTEEVYALVTRALSDYAIIHREVSIAFSFLNCYLTII